MTGPTTVYDMDFEVEDNVLKMTLSSSVFYSIFSMQMRSYSHSEFGVTFSIVQSSWLNLDKHWRPFWRSSSWPDEASW